MPCLLQDGSQARLLAQNLNNRGAQYFESGDHDRAIASLAKALKLWNKVSHDDESCDWCSSRNLDECIMRTSQCSSYAALHHAANSASRSSLSLNQSEEEHFVYRKPIYLLPQREHSPGSTLSFIIILNLAMAHHMSAIQHQPNRRRLHRVLQLYELANQKLQLKENIRSRFASMIIANNVGEIQYIMCLQHLLSATMLMIDCHKHLACGSIELEGFSRNTSRLILHNNCAGIA
jgi:tetratricopeptide (TPR) repeat protein